MDGDTSQGLLTCPAPRRWLVVILITLAALVVIGFAVVNSDQPDPDEVLAWIDVFELSAREQRVPGNAEVQKAITHIGGPDYYSERQGICYLSMASIRFNDELVQWLLEQGADPNPPQGPLPLHGALAGKHPNNQNIVKLLLEHGADPNRQETGTSSGRTALHVAVYWKSAWAIPMLHAYGADLSKQNALGQTPMGVALEQGDGEVIDMLESLWLDAGKG